MANSRTEIYRIPVDAAGNPDIVQLADGAGPFRKITASIESPLHGWNLYAPFIASPKKTFGPGVEYVFQTGRYQGLDVLGYVELDTLSDFLILFCER